MSNILSVSRITEYKGNKKGKEVRTGYYVIYDSPCGYTKSGKLERTYYDDKYVPKTVLNFYNFFQL